jgi:hypothetical protein
MGMRKSERGLRWREGKGVLLCMKIVSICRHFVSAYMLIGYKLIHTVRSAVPRRGLTCVGLHRSGMFCGWWFIHESLVDVICNPSFGLTLVPVLRSFSLSQIASFLDSRSDGRIFSPCALGEGA